MRLPVPVCVGFSIRGLSLLKPIALLHFGGNLLLKYQLPIDVSIHVLSLLSFAFSVLGRPVFRVNIRLFNCHRFLYQPMFYLRHFAAPPLSPLFCWSLMVYSWFFAPLLNSIYYLDSSISILYPYCSPLPIGSRFFYFHTLVVDPQPFDACAPITLFVNDQACCFCYLP